MNHLYWRVAAIKLISIDLISGQLSAMDVTIMARASCCSCLMAGSNTWTNHGPALEA